MAFFSAEILETVRIAVCVTRLGDFLPFEQLFKVFGNN